MARPSLMQGIEALEAWRTYASGGPLHEDWLRPPIYRSWERAHNERLSPHKPRVDRLEGTELERTIERDALLLRAASPYLSVLGTAAGRVAHAVVVGSNDGTVISLAGDPKSLNGDNPTPPLGSLLGEPYAGSNGIGTALREGTYAEVRGPEHFLRGFHDHYCYGIPLHDSTGQKVGALGLSLRTAQLPHLRVLLYTAARGIEAELRAAELQARVAELGAMRVPGGQALALLHQDVVQSHTAARLQLEMGGLQLRDGKHAAALQDALRSLARHKRQAAIWQLASGVAPTDRLRAHDLVLGVCELLETEARLFGVKLSASSACDPRRAPEVRPAAARRVLAATHRMLRAAGEGGAVALRLAEDASLALSIQSASGNAHVEQLHLSSVRPTQGLFGTS